MPEITESEDFKGKCIWIAEDTPSFRRDLADFFEMHGATTETFADPYRLADKLESIKHGDNNTALPDLILTDWTFSPTPTRKGAYWDEKEADVEGGGQVVIDALKKSGEKIPVVIFTGDDRLARFGSFPDADVSILFKGHARRIIDHVKARLFGPNQGHSM
jgi:CheY-like chemotaxis protein